MRTIVEDRRTRLALAEDAGWGRVSATSVLAGILVGYGAFALLAGLAGALFATTGIDVDLSGDRFRQVGMVGAVVLGVVLFASWTFGGYVAGRMARRAGTTHGLVTFLFGVLVVVAAASVVEASGSTGRIVDGLDNFGVPTSPDQWREIGPLAGIASILGMFLGALWGGTMGERWHTKLVNRALDPDVGPEAFVRASQTKVERAHERREMAVTEDFEDVNGGVPAPPRRRPDRAGVTTPPSPHREEMRPS